MNEWQGSVRVAGGQGKDQEAEVILVMSDDRPLFSPETIQALKGLKIFVIPATLSLCLGAGLVVFAGWSPSSANASQGVAPPLIVSSSGSKFSQNEAVTAIDPAGSTTEVAPAQKSTQPATAVATASAPKNAPGSARSVSPKAANTAVARVQPGMIKVKPPKSQVPSTPAWVCGEHPFIVRAASGQQKLVNPTTLSPDTLDVQGIMNGSQNKAALVDGKLYRVGDRMGAQELQWTVAKIDDTSVTMQREQNNRVFAVTVYASGTGTVSSEAEAAVSNQRSGIR